MKELSAAGSKANDEEKEILITKLCFQNTEGGEANEEVTKENLQEERMEGAEVTGRQGLGSEKGVSDASAKKMDEAEAGVRDVE